MPSTSIHQLFLLEEKRWSNWNSDIYSDYLPYYLILDVILLFTSFILSSPLSLIVTVPTLYYVIAVSQPSCMDIKINVHGKFSFCIMQDIP